MEINKLILISTTIILNLIENVKLDEIDPATPVTFKRRKLWFLSSVRPKTDSDFYCPRKHINTPIEDLCYYFYRHKKTHLAASETCANVSHRLAVLESEPTWNGLLYAIDKFTKRVLTALHAANPEHDFNPNRSLVNFRFHLGAVYRIEKQLFWNKTGTKIDWRFTCNLTSARELATTSGANCLEFVGAGFRSKGGHSWCLKLTDCQSMRYAVCEWRGETIQSFNMQLEAQLLNAYISVLVVFALFVLIWLFIYCLHRKRMWKEISQAFENYKKEIELFDLQNIKRD